MIATLSFDRQTVTMRGERWLSVFPISDLPGKLRFYRGLRDRAAKPGATGPYARFYDPTVKALERVEKMARVMG